MKRFFKILAAAWLTGAIMGSGCFCGALATGMLVPKRGPSDDYLFVQAQIVEIENTLASLDIPPMPQGFDEMAGME